MAFDYGSANSLGLNALNHISRLTGDVEASRAFFTKVLGFVEIRRPSFDFEGSWYALLPTFSPGALPSRLQLSSFSRVDRHAFYSAIPSQHKSPAAMRGLTEESLLIEY